MPFTYPLPHSNNSFIHLRLTKSAIINTDICDHHNGPSHIWTVTAGDGAIPTWVPFTTAAGYGAISAGIPFPAAVHNPTRPISAICNATRPISAVSTEAIASDGGATCFTFEVFSTDWLPQLSRSCGHCYQLPKWQSHSVGFSSLSKIVADVCDGYKYVGRYLYLLLALALYPLPCQKLQGRTTLLWELWGPSGRVAPERRRRNFNPLKKDRWSEDGWFGFRIVGWNTKRKLDWINALWFGWQIMLFPRIFYVWLYTKLYCVVS